MREFWLCESIAVLFAFLLPVYLPGYPDQYFWGEDFHLGPHACEGQQERWHHVRQRPGTTPTSPLACWRMQRTCRRTPAAISALAPINEHISLCMANARRVPLLALAAGFLLEGLGLAPMGRGSTIAASPCCLGLVRAACLVQFLKGAG